MEEIYTVRVRWSAEPGLTFPSERAYSSSTVGGLAAAHLVLAGLAAALSSLGAATAAWRGELAGGASLVAGAVGAGLTGLLAWRRWYEDRHIRWFLGGSVAAGLGAALSALLTALLLLDPAVAAPTTLPPPTLNATAPERFDSTPLHEGGERESFRREIYVHLLLASLVELVWSGLSARIAWKGVGRKRGPERKAGGGRPDILENLRREGEGKAADYADVVRELCGLQKAPPPGHHLPLPESRLEYSQRMDRFLAATAALP